MKKLLSILGAMGMSAMAGATVVACSPGTNDKADFDIAFNEDGLKEVNRDGTFDVTIEGYEEMNLIDLAIVDETDSLTIAQVTDKGVITLTAVKAGENIEFYFTANEGEPKTQEDTPKYKSSKLTITILEVKKIGDVIDDKFPTLDFETLPSGKEIEAKVAETLKDKIGDSVVKVSGKKTNNGKGTATVVIEHYQGKTTISFTYK